MATRKEQAKREHLEAVPPQNVRVQAPNQGANAPEASQTAADSETAGPLLRILSSLRAKTGQDFSAYKKSTLWRRVERRVLARNVADVAAYAGVLEQSPEEVELLFRELLISVTSFFRDPQAFAALRAHLFGVLSTWNEERPFRAWVPACASGEEVYSIAILLREVADELRLAMKFQFFATDLDRPAIEFARSGHYPLQIAEQVTPERLQRFFARTDAGYRIDKEIREGIVFAPQNVIKDPPFTRLDLLSCRNLLIYL